MNTFGTHTQQLKPELFILSLSLQDLTSTSPYCLPYNS